MNSLVENKMMNNIVIRERLGNIINKPVAKELEIRTVGGYMALSKISPKFNLHLPYMEDWYFDRIGWDKIIRNAIRDELP